MDNIYARGSFIYIQNTHHWTQLFCVLFTQFFSTIISIWNIGTAHNHHFGKISLEVCWWKLGQKVQQQEKEKHPFQFHQSLNFGEIFSCLFSLSLRTGIAHAHTRKYFIADVAMKRGVLTLLIKAIELEGGGQDEWSFDYSSHCATCGWGRKNITTIWNEIYKGRKLWLSIFLPQTVRSNYTIHSLHKKKKKFHMHMFAILISAQYMHSGMMGFKILFFWFALGETVRWSYLGISQHHILDERQATRLAVFHTYIMNLVATDLSVLLAWRKRTPHHLNCCGVEDLHLHPPWRSPRNYKKKKILKSDYYTSVILIHHF